MNTDLLIEGLLQTLWMVIPSALLAQLVGTLLGVLLVTWHPGGVGARPTAYRIAGAVVNVGRSLPFVILLVLVIPLSRWLTGTSIGATAAIVPLTIAAIPFIARLVEAALLEVPRGVVEAARAFGATRRQILLRVLLPEAVPSLVRGFTVALVSLIGYSAMAGAIGGGGLGDLAIRYGYQRFEAGILFATVIALVALVQLSQSFGERVALELDHRVSRPPGGRRRLAVAGAVAVLAVIALVVVAGRDTPAAVRTGTVLRIGASPTPHAEILEIARPLLAARGVAIEVRVFDDYIQPNLALGDGSIDVNYFQTVPYLDEFQRSRPLGIVPSTKVHIEPMALYSDKIKAVGEIPAGSIIAIPNDPSNSGRALNLLAKAGLVRLAPGATIRATVRDVVENPKSLSFREIDAAQLPRVLPDVAAAVLNANYAFEAGLSPTRDGIFVEDGDSPYANILAAKQPVIDSPAFAVLQEVMNSAEVRRFIVERYQGSVLPAFEARSPAPERRSVLRIGASATPHAEILEVARPLLAARGIDLEIRVFNDYVHPNLALGDGSIDANFFQHVPYLDEFQRKQPLGIAAGAPIFVAPMALYSRAVTSLDAIAPGSTIAIPNDPSNSGRALHLLAKAGLVRLAPGASIRATMRDVVDNPRRLVIRELDAAQLPHALPDVAAAVLNTNYALQAGLHPAKDGLVVEDADSPYANVVAARPDVLRRPEVVALQEVLAGPEVRAFIERRFAGSIVPVD